MKRSNVIFFILLLILIIQEGECRRKILKGRKTVNRTYYRGMAIPAWAVCTLVGLGEIIIGAILFIILKFLILDQEKVEQIRESLIARSATP